MPILLEQLTLWSGILGTDGMLSLHFRLVATVCKSFTCVIFEVPGVVKALETNFLTREDLFQHLMSVASVTVLRIAEFNTVGHLP